MDWQARPIRPMVARARRPSSAHTRRGCEAGRSPLSLLRAHTRAILRAWTSSPERQSSGSFPNRARNGLEVRICRDLCGSVVIVQRARLGRSQGRSRRLGRDCPQKWTLWQMPHPNCPIIRTCPQKWTLASSLALVPLMAYHRGMPEPCLPCTASTGRIVHHSPARRCCDVRADVRRRRNPHRMACEASRQRARRESAKISQAQSRA